MSTSIQQLQAVNIWSLPAVKAAILQKRLQNAFTKSFKQNIQYILQTLGGKYIQEMIRLLLYIFYC